MLQNNYEQMYQTILYFAVDVTLSVIKDQDYEIVNVRQIDIWKCRQSNDNKWDPCFKN